MQEQYDVVVVGSGAAGMMAALRAHDRGLRVLVIEKAHKFGGTSATSGGIIWLANSGGPASDDSREESFKYLNAIQGEGARPEKISAFIDAGRTVRSYLETLGLIGTPAHIPDYFAEMVGSRADRSLLFPRFDGWRLGERFVHMREQFTRFKLLNRYAMTVPESFAISTQAKGWMPSLARIIAGYWLDVRTRGRTRRDRWLTLGGSLIGPLYLQMINRGIEVRLSTRLTGFTREAGRITGVEVQSHGPGYVVGASRGVIACAGGFEWNQELRDKYLRVPTQINWCNTPEFANTGDALCAAAVLDADTEFTQDNWWVPTMLMPIASASNYLETHQAFFDVGRPHSLCVNRFGHRFTNEAQSYDRFGNAMADDHVATGANLPCWLIFDARFRRKYTVGGLMPAMLMPDRRIPNDWWDQFIFRSDTILGLAHKIGLPAETLERTVHTMNGYAQTGVDAEFGRGSSDFERSTGYSGAGPNPCLGAIDKAPFYAVPIYLGDIGSKGGLKTDESARVLNRQGHPIPGLWAAGNASGNPFGNCYPGAGGTLGPALTFGYIAGDNV